MKVRNSKYFIIVFLFVIIMCSCNRNNKLTDTSKSNNSTNYYLQDIEKGITSTTNDDNHNTASNFFSKYISLGRYKKNILLEGRQRDPKIVLIEGNSIIFPEGMLINITTKTSGTTNKFLDISSEKAKAFLDFIESQNLINETNIKNPDRKLIGAEIRLILLNTVGKYIMAEIYSFNDNNHRINIYYEDENNLDINNYYLQSKELTKKIKDLSGWKYINREELRHAIKAICKNVDTGEKTELTQKELKDLTTAIINAKDATIDTSCPYNISIEITIENGEIIHMIWAGDSCGNLGIEGSAYLLDNEYVTQLRKILK